MSSRELPYVFDLLWDVKNYEQVGRIARYEGDCSDASPEDLVELFQQESLPIPPCLVGFAPQATIWVCKDGTWVDNQPPSEDGNDYRKVRIKGFTTSAAAL